MSKKEKTPDTHQPNWTDIKKYTVVMFQSIRGPIMGLADPRCRRWHNTLNTFVWGVDGIVRLWAPANVGMPNERNVMWMPLMFCEEFVDLRTDSAAFFGTNEVPDIVKQGYLGYLEEFLKGAYKMKPIVADIGIDAVQFIKTDPRVPEAAPAEAGVITCGSCGGTTAKHKEGCTAAAPKVPCAKCHHPGHAGRSCQMPSKVVETEPCGCTEYVPTLSSVPEEAPIQPTDLGQMPPPVPRA